MAERTALVTGATGFIGAHVARRLSIDGWEIHAVVRPTSDLQRLGATKPATVHVHDGTTEGMLQIMRAADPGIVVHLAAMASAEHRSEDVAALVDANIVFATQVAESAAVQGVRMFLNTATYWQHYGNADYSPVSLYAACKEAFDKILRYYVEAYGMRAINLVLFDTYGEDDERPKLFNLLREAVRTGKPLAMTPGEQLIDLLHVEDVADAYGVAARLLERGHGASRHETYVVRSGRPVRLRDLVETYAAVTGRPVPVQWGMRGYRKREVMAPWEGGVRLPGWSPRIGLEEGIRRLVR